MTSTGDATRAPRRRRHAAATVTALLLSAGLTAAALTGAGSAAATANPATTAADAATAAPAAPALIPALDSWSPGTGSLTPGPATRIDTDAASAATARTLAADLLAARGWHTPVVGGPARPGDIVLRTDPHRTALGAEGYALDVGDEARITGGTAAGVFYGTRTVLQLLAAGPALPAGSTTDVPSSAERAVGVCACYTYNTDAWFARLIKDMAYLKLNTLHLELKVRNDAYPGVNSFSYYTKPELRALVALAARYHITVIPEINSPGHVDPYITAYPDLQLTNASGVKDPTRLDVTNPDSFTFYTHLIDNDLSVFPGPYFHMGADEYMVNSAYSDFPQLLAYARQKFGPNATAQDAYVDFVNRVDAYVRSKGRTLRIWNDGLTGANTIPLNKDIVVEHWLPEKVTAQNLLDSGYRVMNATDSWYYVRGSYQPAAQRLYESGWTPLDFADGTVTDTGGRLTGAEYNVWPDNYGKETENQTQQGMFTSLRAFAQGVWGSPKPAPDYASFTALAAALGHAPGYGPQWVQPLPAGTYRIRAGAGELTAAQSAGSELTIGAGTDWRLRPTDDGYYQVVAADSGLCADVDRGRTNNMHVVEQAGAAASAETCGTAQSQKWQLEPVPGGYRVVNAITQQTLDAPGAGGTVVQQPRDAAGHAVWRITAAGGAE
ncbi:family 20 glycosylhydrolase [Actinacidiphila acididurans]|uniref:Family 20 glycosylhydrolase n=1 Tax=Actinacidiphila acididurans TaxID=2784346 RepID=A0ABS2TMM6_9ACTN|nr:family 20 glycosylhydrolase [Actinacidiphila acididurans]MBM9504312.1 family 20 glycosylhydrolase [Actinacidiphila acididurans]